jgi:nitrogen regulatory protein PII-like uncharacterized protein
MRRFRKYFDETLNVVNAKNANQLSAFRVSCKSISEPLEDFDEVEFITDFSDQDVLISIVVQSGKIKRIQFTLLDTENPDAVKGLTEAQLKDLLIQKGDQLVGFFDYITQL